MTTLDQRLAHSYDALPYLSGAFGHSAPEHLQAVARLFAIDAAPPNHARVLELGCAAGGNLLPFAARWPQAEVVGVDLSARQIEAGHAAAQAMGLRNARFVCTSLSTLPAELGPFDYIIAHGVYSWVPEPTRQALLALCGRLLAPQGIAYLSYNTYPGWKTREAVRDAMLLHNPATGDAGRQLPRAREMLGFLRQHMRPGSVGEQVLAAHWDTVQHGRAHYLAHDYLELCNAPCYFNQFVAAAASEGLAYLAEAEVASMYPEHYGVAPGEPALRQCQGDQLAIEQLLDFVQWRSFRQTLLCRAPRPHGSFQLQRQQLRGMHLAGQFQAHPQDRWQAASGAWVVATEPAQHALLQRLQQHWPATLAVDLLLQDQDDAAQQATLGFIAELILAGAVRYRCQPVHCANTLAAQPRVPAPLRQLARSLQQGEQPIALFNAWHESPTLAPLAAALLPLLDGRHDHVQLAAITGADPDALSVALEQLRQLAMLDDRN